jgi:hypothetical protein
LVSENVGLEFGDYIQKSLEQNVAGSMLLLTFNILQVLFSNLEVKILTEMEYMTKMMLVQKLLV